MGMGAGPLSILISEMGDGVIHAADCGETFGQYGFRAVFDLVGGKRRAIRVLHIESECGVGDKVHLIAHITGISCGGFAALFGADAANGELINVIFLLPDIQCGADKGAVACFFDHQIGGEGEGRKCFDVARGFSKSPFWFDMKDLHQLEATLLGGIN